jgi:hypothetical protein
MFAAKQNTEVIPEHVYVSLPTDLLPIALTIPDVESTLEMNPELSGNPNAAIVAKFVNGGRFKFQGRRLDVASWAEGNYKIDSVRFQNGETFSAEQILQSNGQILSRYLDSIDGLNILGEISQSAGLGKGEYLYRAISDQESLRLKNGDKHHLYAANRHPTTNFENQAMFDSEHSQAKLYHSKEDYSGEIIRFKIADTRLYRVAVFAPLRVIANFAHYLPRDIELSKDGGKSFFKLRE